MNLLHRKSVKRLGMCIGIVSLFAPLFGSLYISPPDSQIVLDASSRKAAIHEANLIPPKPSVSTPRCDSVEIVPPRLHQADLRLAPGILKGSVQIDRLIKGSQNGEERSALALFFLVQSCAPYRDYLTTNDVISDDSLTMKHDICSSVPSKLIHDPLSILDAAAMNGSVRAQIVYARNAWPVLKYKTFLNPQISDDEKAQITQKAEAYAIEAANAGASPAFEILATAYEAGSFGKQDLPRSYAYMSALSRSGLGDNSISRANELYGNMTRVDFIKATKLMQPCPAGQSNSFGGLKDLF